MAGFPPDTARPPASSYRTIPETSLDMVMTAAEQGRDFFWG